MRRSCTLWRFVWRQRLQQHGIKMNYKLPVSSSPGVFLLFVLVLGLVVLLFAAILLLVLLILGSVLVVLVVHKSVLLRDCCWVPQR